MSAIETTDRLEALRSFFRQHVPAAAAASIEPATPLLGTDLLDSLAVIQLMVFVGESFGVTIEDEDFTPENLASVGSLIELVERKRTACA